MKSERTPSATWRKEITPSHVLLDDRFLGSVAKKRDVRRKKINTKNLVGRRWTRTMLRFLQLHSSIETCCKRSCEHECSTKIRNVPAYVSIAISVILSWATSVVLDYVIIFHAQNSKIHTLNVYLVTRHFDRKPTSDNENYDNRLASSPQKNYRPNFQTYTSCVIRYLPFGFQRFVEHHRHSQRETFG